MRNHRLSKQFNPDLRDLNILHDHPDPSVKYGFLFTIDLDIPSLYRSVKYLRVSTCYQIELPEPGFLS